MELPFRVWYDSEQKVNDSEQKVNNSEPVWNLGNSAELLGMGSESKFVCVIRVTKHCEIGVLQAASIGLSPAFPVAFHEPTFPTF